MMKKIIPNARLEGIQFLPTAAHILAFVASFTAISLQILVARAVSFDRSFSEAWVVLPYSSAGIGLGVVLATRFLRSRSSGILLLCSSLTLLLGAWGFALWTWDLPLLFLTVPLFIPAGACLAGAFLVAEERPILRTYIFDLCGALTGIVFVPIILPIWGLEIGYLFVALALCLSAFAYLSSLSFFWKFSGAALALLIVALIGFQGKTNKLSLTLNLPLKTRAAQSSDTTANLDTEASVCLKDGHCQLVASAWDITANVDAIRSARKDTVILYYNNVYFSPIDTGSYKSEIISTLPSNGKVLVIGAGGGAQLRQSYLAGIRDITGVEINEATISLMTGPLRELSEEAYSHARIFAENGRSFVARSQEKFDVIILSWVDLFTALFYSNVFHENYLYTAEALESYLDHLSDGGTLLIQKHFPAPNSLYSHDLTRVLTEIVHLLRKKGIDPSRSLVLTENFSGSGFPYPHGLTILVRKIPFAQHDLEKLVGYDTFSKLDRMIFPTLTPFSDKQIQSRRMDYPEMNKLLKEIIEERAPEEFKLDRIVTDDWPYFYNIEFNGAAIARSLEVLGWVAALTVLALVLIVFRYKLTLSGLGQVAFLSTYLGFVFGLLESVLLQAFSLFVGKPLLTLIGVNGGLLLGCLCGVYLSRRLSVNGLKAAFLAMPVLLALDLILVKPWLWRLGIENAGVRTAILIMQIVPIGALASVVFPRLIQFARRQNRAIPGLLLGFNYLACGLGVIASMVLAFYHGFQFTQIVTILGYLLGSALLFLLSLFGKSVIKG